MQVPFRLRRAVRQMWFLPAMFSLGALATIVAAHYSAFLLPQDLPFDVSQDATERILTIVASSMLAVATFALATMVNALAGASQRTTPRAVRLVAEDRAAQAAISAFVGAFLFSIVGIIALSGGFYSASGRLILFAATSIVVLIVVAALIRWINKISSIGQVGEIIERVEDATTRAFREVAHRPCFGCLEQSAAPNGSLPLHALEIGYVQHLYPEKLQAVAEEHDLRIHVSARPGAYVSPVRPLVHVTGLAGDHARSQIRDAFVLGRERTFDHDPRYGLIVLNEIADRALSPGVNDPGTAISVIHTVARILDGWIRCMDESEAILEYDRISMMPISPDELLTDAFRPILRDGSNNVEVCLRLVASLEVIRALSPERFEGAVRRAVYDLLERVGENMAHPADAAAVKSAARGMTI